MHVARFVCRCARCDLNHITLQPATLDFLQHGLSMQGTCICAQLGAYCAGTCANPTQACSQRQSGKRRLFCWRHWPLWRCGKDCCGSRPLQPRPSRSMLHSAPQVRPRPCLACKTQFAQSLVAIACIMQLLSLVTSHVALVLFHIGHGAGWPYKSIGRSAAFPTICAAGARCPAAMYSRTHP